MKNKVCRVYSTSREDIFNICIKELPEWSILYKMLFDTELNEEYTSLHSSFDPRQMNSLPIEAIQQAAKFQVEYYFGQTHYIKDGNMREYEAQDGWILF